MDGSMEFDFPLVLPPGYRFIPNDDELISYLKMKVANTRFGFSAIHDADIYSYTPDQLANEYMGLDDNACYFFTPMIKKYDKGSVANRVAVGGRWKATGDKPIYAYGDGRKREIIGRKRSLAYRIGEDVKTDWLMQEYRLYPNQVHPEVGDWVVCKIYKTPRKTTEDANNGHVQLNHHWDMVIDHLDKEEEQVPKPDDADLHRYYNELLGLISHDTTTTMAANQAYI